MTGNSRIVLKGLKKDVPDMKVIEPFQPEIIDCENKEDFSIIINSDPEKYKDMTTQKLNKLFNIPGYKITKIKGEICLRKIKQENHINNDELEKIQQQINEIKEAFNLLTEQFETIKTMVIGQ